MLILFITSIISIGLFFYGQNLMKDLNKLRESEVKLFTESRTLNLHFSEFQRALGFGGYIHNVKEYVLYRNPNQLYLLEANIEELERSYAAFKVFFQEHETNIALESLDVFLSSLRESYDFMVLSENQNLEASELNDLLNLETPEILSSLITLETFKDNYNRRATKQIQSSIDDLVSDLLIASILLPFIFFMGIFLIYLLNRAYKASQDLEYAKQQLIDSEEWLEATGITAKVGGWEIESDKSSVKMTKETYRIFEIPQGKTLSMQAMVDLFPSNNKNVIVKKMQESFQKGTPFDLELSYVGLMGKKGFVHVICSPMSINGEVVKLRGAIQDITERKNLEDQLLQANKMEAIGQLAGGIAHDFNNMLSIILNAAQLLQFANKNLDADSNSYIDMIMKSSTRAADLTAKLLAFGGKILLKKNSVNLHNLIDEVISIFNRTIDKSISIDVSKNADKCVVNGDISLLQNVIMNLGINASHAMDDGGEISITTRNVILDQHLCNTSAFDLNEGEYCEIEVRDTGRGISPDNLKKIFDPFFTTKDVEKGTGLGLASVYRTVLDHHGSIEVHSVEGYGTSFHLLFPCEQVSAKNEDVDQTLLSGAGLILVVDDEEYLRTSAQLILQNMGYSTLIAENGEGAIKIYSEQQAKIDLVLLDMIMPRMKGSEVFYKLREINPHCKVIISSGYTKDENLQELTDAGLAGFISKPYRNFEMSQLLSKVLNT
jgi:signal transduction histidine kinase/CheY-like chemotaxis protein